MDNNKWLSWFEIPAADFQRALVFYSAIFQVEITPVVDTENFKMAMFPRRESGNGGICWGKPYKPNIEGPLVYFDANPRLDTVLARVEGAGGKILQPKKLISEDYGYMALFMDSEGNRVALHSQS